MKRCKLCEMAFVVLGWSALMSRAGQPASAPATKGDAPATPTKSVAERRMVAAPHPMICEILYAVPKGDEGDADQNGTRSATGDEFIEIYNPHKDPIELKGYVLSDAVPLHGPESDSAKSPKRPPSKGKNSAEPATPPDKSPAKRSRLRFEFPALTLQPGEVAVVFNGFESRPVSSVGTQSASSTRNEKFGNAFVFTMDVKSKFGALANDGDCVTLFAPDGRAIQCVHWGTHEAKKLDSAILMMEAPESKGSVVLDPESGQFVEHPAVDTDRGQRFFSPGTYGESASIAKPVSVSPKKAAPPKAPAPSTKQPQPTGDPK